MKKLTKAIIISTLKNKQTKYLLILSCLITGTNTKVSLKYK